ncbi:hypothetical protein Tco_0766912 [Tanacetum coccineum]
MASVSIGGVSLKSLINHSLNGFWSHVVWVGVVRRAVSDVHRAGTRVHIPARGGSEAHNGPPDSILSHKPKPLEKHRPPPPQSVWSLDKLSYPP